jgi:hypothetical protein
MDSYSPRSIGLACLVGYPLVGLAAQLAFGRGHGPAAVLFSLFVLPAGSASLTANCAGYSPAKRSALTAGVIVMCVFCAFVALVIAFRTGAYSEL